MTGGALYASVPCGVMPEQPAAQVLALLQPRQAREDVFERDGEPDAAVVPLDAGRLALAADRRRDDDAVHAAVDGHERPAVVHRRRLRVGLDRLAPDAGWSR